MNRLRALLFCGLVSAAFVLSLYALTSTPSPADRFVPADDPYPTMRLVPEPGTPRTWDFHRVEPAVVSPIAPASPPPPPRPLVDAPKFLVLGDADCTVTAIATDGGCWASTSGGTDIAGVPDADDTTNLDANSGAGTGTMDAAMTVGSWNATGFTGTITTGGFALTSNGAFTTRSTFNAGASTITVTGTWDSTVGTFNRGTSTAVAAGSATWSTIAGTTSTTIFFNLTVNAAVTLTIANNIALDGTLTTAASVTLNSNCNNGIFFNGTSAFTRGASNIVWTPIRINASAGFTLPAGEYRGNSPGVEALSAVTVTPAGNVTLSTACGGGGAGDMELEAGTYAKGTTTLTVQGDLLMLGGDLTSTSGDVVVSLTVNISSAASAIDFGSEVWTVSGSWTNASTDGTVWDAGTGIVLFDATSAQTMTFAGSNLSEDEFATVDLASAAGPNVTFTMATRGLRLNFLNIYTATFLDTSGSNLAVTTNRLDIASGSGITLNASTLTVSGNMDIQGTYSGASATLVLSGSSAQTIAMGGSNVNALSVTGSGTKSFTSAFVTSTVTLSVAVTFQVTAGVTWTHNGTALVGVAGGFLTLRSGTSGSAWNLSRGGASLTATRVDVADSSASAIVDACGPSNLDSGGNDNWDFCVEVRPPQGPRTLSIDVVCGYNSFVRVWSCTDRTDYTGWEPAVFERLTYQYDGREVAVTSSQAATVTFEAGGSVLEGDSVHLLLVTWSLYNGGTPSSTFVLQVDNRPAQITFALAGLVLLFAIVAAVIRRRGAAIAYESVPNPSYRQWPSEEFPQGWRTYRRVPHRADLPTRSERKGDRWVIYQLRPATAEEQQRTGRKRIAYVQAVREKM